MAPSVDAVLLIALGGPGSMQEVRPFIKSVLGGRPVRAQRIEEVAHHYEAVGGRSPLTELTIQQAQALEQQLARDGLPMPVFVGMRCWSPWLTETVREMARRGVRRAAAVVMITHRDRYTWAQYEKSLSDAREVLLGPVPQFFHVPPWHDHPLYVEALAGRISEKVAEVEAIDPETTPLVLTAHSMPAGLADIDEYVARIRTTCELVAQELSWKSWLPAYQSRTGRPEEPWLEPDVCTVIRRLADEGHRSVLVASCGFLCDHVEVLYDLDIESGSMAARRRMVFARAATVGAHPSFIRMMSELVRGLSANV